MRRSTTCLHLLGALGLLAALAPPAPADVLVLKDGRILEREKMESTEKGVAVQFENGTIVVPHDAIEEAVLTVTVDPSTLTDEERENLEKGLVRYKGRWIKKDRRDAILAKEREKRREYVEMLRKHSRWGDRHKTETRHFRFEYTVAPFVYDYYATVMEAYFKAFAKTWKIKPDKDIGKLLVCFYSDLESFHQTGGVRGGVQGYFRFVKPMELNFYYNRVDPEQTEQVMYHEANHYLQKLLDPAFKMPHFPGEAIAEYYGSSQYDADRKQLTTGHILEGRLTEVHTDIAAGNMLGLEKMIRTDGMYEHYTWGWTLAHFLMNDKKYQKRFVKFVKGLVFDKKVNRVTAMAGLSTVEPDEVWRYFMDTLKLKSGEDVLELEKAWHDYIQNTLKTQSTRGLELAAQSAARVGRPIRGKRLFKEAIEAGSTNPLTYFGYAKLLERDNKTSEAIANFRKAIELGPLEAEFYASLGRAMARSGEKDEGIRFMKLSLELDPDNPWLAETVRQYQENESE